VNAPNQDNIRAEYNAWLNGVECCGEMVTLRDYRKWSAYDSNLVWRLSSGTIASLLDDAIDVLDQLEDA
jgi:hypothetical protein